MDDNLWEVCKVRQIVIQYIQWYFVVFCSNIGKNMIVYRTVFILTSLDYYIIMLFTLTQPPFHTYNTRCTFQLEKGDDTEDGDDDEDKSGQEMRSQGSVKSKVYLQYFRAGSGWWLMAILIICNVITQVLFTGTDYFLSYW